VIEQYGKGTPDDFMDRRIYTPLAIGGPVVTLVTNLWLFGTWGVAMWLFEMAWIPFFAAASSTAWDTGGAIATSRPRRITQSAEPLLVDHHLRRSAPQQPSPHPESPRFAMRKGELDPGYWYFRALSFVGLARDASGRDSCCCLAESDDLRISV
jgi:stearoyl-CoA desaturase (delta-9 desaturase)